MTESVAMEAARAEKRPAAMTAARAVARAAAKANHQAAI